MREELAKIGVDTKSTFTGWLSNKKKSVHYGTYKNKTKKIDIVLIKNLKDIDGNKISDHVWIEVNKDFEKANIKPNNQIMFNAIVKTYVKGFTGKKGYTNKLNLDYKLTNMSGIKLIPPSSCRSKR